MAKVKVRIAVAVDPSGNWCSCGWATATDDDSMSNVVDGLDEGEVRYWLEAEIDIPVPSVPTIQATVTEAPHGNR